MTIFKRYLVSSLFLVNNGRWNVLSLESNNDRVSHETGHVNSNNGFHSDLRNFFFFNVKKVNYKRIDNKALVCLFMRDIRNEILKYV